jgi:hypothetical protein
MHSSIFAGNKPTPRYFPTENNLFLLACLLCGLPVWLPHYPPMVDLPQHAAQVTLMLNMNNPDFPLSNQYQFNLFTPYLLGYLLIAAVTPLIGVVAACKLVVWATLFALAIASRYLLRRTGADPYWAWLVFPTLYGFSYQWGFLSFLVAAPVGVAFLGLIWNRGIDHYLRSSLLVVVMLYVLFFCHALTLGLFSLIAALYWYCSAPRLRDLIKTAWPLISLLPVVAIWFSFSNQDSGPQPLEWDLSWFDTNDYYYRHLASWVSPTGHDWGRVTGFIPRLLGVRPSIPLTLVGVTLFILPFLGGGRLATSRVRYVPLALLLLVLLFLPSGLFESYFAFQRFVLFSMPLFLVVIDTPKRLHKVQRVLRLTAPLIAFGWIFWTSYNAMQIDKDSEEFDAVMSKMLPYKSTLSLIFAKDDNHSITPTFVNFPAWYSAIRIGTMDPSPAEFAKWMPITLKPEFVSKPGLRAISWFPQEFDWKIHNGRKFDYFIVRAQADAGAFISRHANCSIYLVAHSGLWWLYQKSSDCR